MSHCLFRVNFSDKHNDFITADVVLRVFFLVFFFGYIFSSQFAHATQTSQLSNKSQQVLAVCQSCHGENLSGQSALNAPAIAGQSLSYLNRQITKFRHGSRGGSQADSAGQQMANIAATLNDADSLLAVNQYISNLTFQAEINLTPPVSSTQHLADDSRKLAMQLKQGSNYYQGKCGACHGGNGEGNEKMFAPRLNNLSASYLSKQMKNFTDGSRGDQSDDKYGRQMAMMAKTSSGQELKNIIMFINKVGLKASTGEHRE